MNKILVLFLFIVGLIAYVNAAYVVVNVGGLGGENVFIPQTVFANVGDNIIFNWMSGTHSVIETDEPQSCIKSSRDNAFSSGGEFTAPNRTMSFLAESIGQKYFFCGVPGHCENGMRGTIIITLSSSNSSSISPPPSSISHLFFDNNQTPVILIGVLVGVSILIMIGSLILYVNLRRRINTKEKGIVHSDDNILQIFAQVAKHDNKEVAI